MIRASLILACSVALALLLILAVMRPAPAAAHGVAHPDFPSMNQGGQPQRHDGLRVIAWAYGVTQTILFAGLLSLGATDRDKSRRPMTVIFAVAATHATALSLLIWMDYRGFGPSRLFFSFPAATTMVLTMIAVPGIFIVLYIKNFSDWVYGEREAERFEALKQRYQSSPVSAEDARHG